MHDGSGTPTNGEGEGVTTVLGVGNPLLGDDGAGLRAAEMLRERAPAGVRILARGPLGADVLPDVEDASYLLVLDSIDAGRRPGEVLRLDWAELPDPPSPSLSPHELSLKEILAMAALRGREPREVVVMGIQPSRFGPGLALSPEVAASVPRLVELALAVLARWASGTFDPHG